MSEEKKATFTVSGTANIAERGIVDGSITITYTGVPYQRAVELKENILREVGLIGDLKGSSKSGPSVATPIPSKKEKKMFNRWQMKYLHGLPDGMTKFDVCSSFRRRFKRADVADTFIFNEYTWFRGQKALGVNPSQDEPAAPAQERREKEKPQVPESCEDFEVGDIVHYARGLPGSHYPNGKVIEAPHGKGNARMLVKFGVADDKWVSKYDYEIVEKAKKDG